MYDVRVVHGDGIADGGKVAIEKDMVVGPGRGRGACQAPADGDAVAGYDLPASRFDDFEPWAPLAGRDGQGGSEHETGNQARQVG